MKYTIIALLILTACGQAPSETASVYPKVPQADGSFANGPYCNCQTPSGPLSYPLNTANSNCTQTNPTTCSCQYIVAWDNPPTIDHIACQIQN